MTHLFIINPTAGKYDRTEEIREKVRQAQQERGIECHIAVSQKPGDCRRIARKAAESGEELKIYACGGDGTLNEVVNGVAGFPNVAVTHYAGGSGNDFVRAFGTIEPFRDLNELLDCEEANFDLVRCNDDYAINICSVGFDARIGTEVSAYKRLPLVSGPMAYVLSAMVNTVKGTTDNYVVTCNGKTVKGKQTMICVCNGSFYGGGFNPVPEANPCDGILDVLLVGPVSRLKVLQVIGKYKNGRYKELSDLAKHVRTRELTIECNHDTPVNLDGELRMSRRIHIQMTDQKIRFFYPKSLHWTPGKRKFEVSECI